jgi:hypothetical protein
LVVLEEEVAGAEGPEGVGDDNGPENISKPKSHDSAARPGKGGPESEGLNQPR